MCGYAVYYEVLLVCCCGEEIDVKDAQRLGSKFEVARQIYSPRMGKDISAATEGSRDENEEDGDSSSRHLYVRIPPLPKLGKTFDAFLSQYRRANDAIVPTNMKADKKAVRAVSMLRMGRSSDYPSRYLKKIERSV